MRQPGYRLRKHGCRTPQGNRGTNKGHGSTPLCPTAIPGHADA